MSEGKFRECILQGKIHGDFSREMVDASYVWAALEEAFKDFPSYKVGYGQHKTQWIANILKWRDKWFGSKEEG